MEGELYAMRNWYRRAKVAEQLLSEVFRRRAIGRVRFAAESRGQTRTVARGRCSRREPYPWRAAPSGRRTPASRDPQRPKRPNGPSFGAADTLMPRHDGRGSAHEERSRDEPHSRGGAGESE